MSVAARVPVPAEGPGGDATLDYEVAPLPFPPERLWGGQAGLLTEPEGELYLEWVRREEAGRAGYILGVLGAARAPVTGLPESPAALVPLSAWSQRWVQGAYREWVGGRWDVGPGGAPAGLLTPIRPQGVTPALALASLAHDLAFLVVQVARRSRPDLSWRLSHLPLGVRTAPGQDQPVVRLPVLGADGTTVPPREVHRMLWLALLRPLDDPRLAAAGAAVRDHTAKTHERRLSAHAEALSALHDRLVEGTAAPRMAPRPIPPPARRETGTARQGPRPPAPALVDAVGAYRRAGWFAAERGATDAEVAAALRDRWASLHGGDLLDAPSRLDVRLVALDDGRSLAEDTEVDADPGAGVYSDLLARLAARSGGRFDPSGVSESWAGDSGEVVLSFAWRGRRHEMRLHHLDRLDPGILTEVNRLVGRAGIRFWSVDDGGQQFLVTRASPAERQALQAGRPVRLDPDPPGWWSDPQPG